MILLSRYGSSYDLGDKDPSFIVVYESISDYLAYAPDTPAYNYVVNKAIANDDIENDPHDDGSSAVFVLPFLRGPDSLAKFLETVIEAHDDLFSNQYMRFLNEGTYEDHVNGFAKFLQNEKWERPRYTIIPIDKTRASGYYFF